MSKPDKENEQLHRELDRLIAQQQAIREALHCSPDCPLLTWARIVGDKYHEAMAMGETA